MYLKHLIGAWSAILLVAPLTYNTMAGEVEVLHWWTAGGEVRSLAELKRYMEAAGHQWKDFAVPGGGGESAITVMTSRVISGNPPTAALTKGPAIQELGKQGVLADLEEVAKAEHWDNLLPAVVSNIMKYDGRYVAVPVNVHRINWMWANPAVFKKAGAQIPTNWDEFETAAQKIQTAGFIPVAHGGQAWQDATTFESIVLAVGGADFYRKAFLALNPKALNSPTMVKAFKVLKTVKKYTDKEALGRDWNVATAMVISGKAAMQFMGDWAKGQFIAAGKTPGKDYVCVPVPGSKGMFIFNIDSFVMFNTRDAKAQKAQIDLARIILEAKFQEIFSLNKGSIPARLNMPRDKFDVCARAAMDEFVHSASDGTLVPSMAHGMATFSSVQEAIYDLVTEFYNSDMSPEDAAKKLTHAIQANR